MSLGRMMFIAFSAVVVVTFYALIPVDAYDHYDIFYSAVGGVLLGGCLFLAIGNFDSIYDLMSTPDPGDVVPAERKYAPWAIAPAIVFFVVLLVHHSGRKDDELKAYGVLTKGRVQGGHSLTVRRSTTYNLTVTYYDSLKRPHSFEEDVSSSDFSSTYKGELVDIVYSRRHPSLAKILFDIDDVHAIMKVPTDTLTIDHLITLFEGKVPNDSVVNFLNGINFEWTGTPGETFYSNEKLKIAVKLFDDKSELPYIEESNVLRGKKNSDFVKHLLDNGYKKKVTQVGKKSQELYYNDAYTIAKEFKTTQSEAGVGMRINMYDVYHLMRNDAGE